MSKEAMEHKPTVTEGDNPMYPFLVTCPCAWQAHAKTREQADYYKRHHESASLWLQATKGFQSGR